MNHPEPSTLNQPLNSSIQEDNISISETSVSPKWYQRKWVRVFIVRVLIRMMMLGLFFALVKSGVIPFADLLHAYLDWINSLELGLALLIFALCSIPFSAITPGSYAPTVVAGLTFPLYFAVPLSYFCINAAAMLNLVIIRYGLCCQWIKRRIMTKVQQRQDVDMDALDRLFIYHPLRTIILLRLPYLSSGVLNYMFSTSVLSVRHQLIGNAIGLLPGAFLFSVLGAQARSLTEILFEGKTDATSIIVFVLVSTFVITSILGIVYLVRKKTVQQTTQVAIIQAEHTAIQVESTHRKPENSKNDVELVLLDP